MNSLKKQMITKQLKQRANAINKRFNGKKSAIVADNLRATAKDFEINY